MKYRTMTLQVFVVTFQINEFRFRYNWLFNWKATLWNYSFFSIRQPTLSHRSRSIITKRLITREIERIFSLTYNIAFEPKRKEIIPFLPDRSEWNNSFILYSIIPIKKRSVVIVRFGGGWSFKHRRENSRWKNRVAKRMQKCRDTDIPFSRAEKYRIKEEILEIYYRAE